MNRLLLLFQLIIFLPANAQIPAMVPDFVFRGDISKGGSALPYEDISAVNDADGNIYICFSSRNQDTVFFNGTALNKQADASSTIHLLKYAASGKLLWQKAITRAKGALSYQDRINLIYHNNRLYVASYYSSDVDFGNSVSVLSINNSMNSFVASFQPDGTIDQAVMLQGYLVKTEIHNGNGNILFLMKKTAADSIIRMGNDSVSVGGNYDEKNIAGEISMTGNLVWHTELPESFNLSFSKAGNTLVFYNTDLQRHSTADSLAFPGLKVKNDAAQARKNGYFLRFDLALKSFSKALVIERSRFGTTEGSVAADDSGNLYTANFYGDTLTLGSEQFIEGFNKKWVVFKMNNNLDIQWIKTSTSTVTHATDRYLRYYNADSLMVILVNNDQSFAFGSVSVAPWSEFMNSHTSLAYYIHMNKNGNALNAWPIYGVYPQNLTMLNHYHVMSSGIITLEGIKILSIFYPKADPARYVQHGWLTGYYSIGQLSSISEKYKNSSFNIYPNPASDYVNIDLNGVEKVNLIHAGSGRQQCVELIDGRLDISSLARGFYIVQLRMKDQVLNAKLLVE